MKVPFINSLTHSLTDIQPKAKKPISSHKSTISHKSAVIENNLYRRFINFIDKIKTSSLPEDTKNIDSMF